MNYKDIIYPTLTALLDDIKSKIDGYIEENGENDELNSKYDEIENISYRIEEVYADDLGDPCLSELTDNVEAYTLCSQGIESEEWYKFKVLYKLAKVIEGDGTFNLEESIGLNAENFCLIGYNGPAIPFFALAHINTNDVNNTIAYLNIENDGFDNELSENGFTPSCTALFLYLLANKPDFSENNKYILCRSDNNNTHASAQAALKTIALINKKSVHTEILVSNGTLPLYLKDKVSTLDAYSQFEETLIILSEFNKRVDILGKYLSIYHVIESFMYKIPLVNLGSQNNGGIFSIRDFQLLYDQTTEREITSIEKMFNDSEMGNFWSRNIGGTPFSQLISTRVSQLSGADFNTSEFSGFMKKLGVKSIENYTDICSNQKLKAKSYAQIVYKVRCAIVHNKETEMHISHFNLNKTVAKFIENILIHPLELLVYDLITDNTSKVWYKGPELRLYSQ